MYLPQHFAETRTEVLHALIRAHSLGALVVAGPQGLDVNHLPFIVGGEALGVLTGHVSRANPLWRQAAPGPAVAIFQGPQRYITPSWYARKAEDGKVVPTWNYVVVHAHGSLRFIEDPAWLRAHLEAQVALHEGGRSAPWKIDDAPPEYIEKLLGGIVGVELAIERLEGKWKLGQNRNEADRAGMVEGLLGEGGEAAAALAALIRAPGSQP
jgi:transcriptional regulator